MRWTPPADQRFSAGGPFSWGDWTNLISTAAMVTTAVARLTAEVPVLDIITGSIAAVTDLAVGITKTASTSSATYSTRAPASCRPSPTA